MQPCLTTFENEHATLAMRPGIGLRVELLRDIVGLSRRDPGTKIIPGSRAERKAESLLIEVKGAKELQGSIFGEQHAKHRKLESKSSKAKARRHRERDRDVRG